MSSQETKPVSPNKFIFEQKGGSGDKIGGLLADYPERDVVNFTSGGLERGKSWIGLRWASRGDEIMDLVEEWDSVDEPFLVRCRATGCLTITRNGKAVRVFMENGEVVSREGSPEPDKHQSSFLELI